MSCRQYEGGLQGDGMLPELMKLSDPNGPWTHYRMRSDPSHLSSASLRNGVPRSGGGMPTGSIISGQEVPLAHNDIESRLEVAPDHHSARSDTAIQNLQHPPIHLPDVEVTPRVSSPIELPVLIPPPTFIPPPPISVKQNPKMFLPEKPYVSSGMDGPPSEILVQQPQNPSVIHRPPLHLESSSDYRNDEDESSFNIEWQRIQKLRIDIWSLRSKVHEIRNILREKQLVKSNADDKLLQRISLEGFGLSSRKDDSVVRQKTIAELTEDWRSARGDYGPLEDDCNRLEDQLSSQEFELTRQEQHFYNHWKNPRSTRKELPAFAAFHRPSTSPSPSPSAIVGVDEVPQDHPLVTRFLSRMGDLDILQERLVELEEEKTALEDERDSRQRFHMSLAPEDQAWLDSSQALLDDLLEKTRLTEEDIDRMRQDCFAKGLVDEHGEPTDFQSQERSSFQNEEDMNPKDHKSEYVKHPILLPKPGVKPAPSKGSATESDETSASLGKRINQWILDQLRESPLEVNLLARTFEGWYGEIDDSWEVSVLAVWNDDGTANTKGYHIYTSSMTTQAPLRSDHSSASSNSNPKFHGNQSYQVILAHRLRFPPSPDRSEGTERGTVMGKSQGSWRGKVHWSKD